VTKPVRTRFAPSPTGDPHVGNIRTAVFAWAFARAHGGTFILRIEDTDQNRYEETALQAIFDSLGWLGIEWDEGPSVGGPHAPYFQSQRLPMYQQMAQLLISKGRAYPCFCTPERLDRMRAEQQAARKPPGYDGLCRAIPVDEAVNRARSEAHTVRFKMNREGTTVLRDVVRGEISFENALQEDFVILKSDGFPTYHLALIVDDTEMEISHAIRGDEWLSSAPKHIQIYEALGFEEPVWAHLPLILGTDGKKLSKRSGDTSLLDYRDNGYLPEAMINFLAFLGWSVDDKTSIVSQEDLARLFTLERVVPNPAVFDIERLDYLNGYYIRAMPDHRWYDTIIEWCEKGLPRTVERPLDTSIIAAAAPLLRERVARLDQVPGMLQFLFDYEAPEYDAELLATRLSGDLELALRVVDAALLALDPVGEEAWEVTTVEAAIRGMEQTLELKLRKFVSVLYVAEMGSPAGIPLFDSLALLGRERSLARLRTARAKLAHRRA
jgi:glutamyl-tRNA synthetase